MSSGLVLRTPLPEDAAALMPLKPVAMSGEPGEDTPVFEDIKPPARPLENPLDLAQVRRRPAVCRGAAGRGQRRLLRLGMPPANPSVDFLDLILLCFSALSLKHLRRFVRSCFPLRQVFAWACWVSFFFSFFFFFSLLPFSEMPRCPFRRRAEGSARSPRPGLGPCPWGWQVRGCRGAARCHRLAGKDAGGGLTVSARDGVGGNGRFIF